MHMGPRILASLLMGALLGAPASLAAEDPVRTELESHNEDVSEQDVARLLKLLPSLEGDWTLFELPMLRLLAADAAVVHPAAIRHSARTLEQLLTIFDSDGTLRADLQRKPIRYLHGLTRPEVSLLAGLETDGLALWAPRIVISRRLPHAHELVHIVAHLAMSSPKIASADPVLREGLASYLGGARGRTPQVVLAMGDSYLDLGLGDPSWLLAPDRFFHSSTDASIHYATSARFVQFLVEEHGWEKFARLYRLFASNATAVSVRPTVSRMLQYAGVYGRSWEQLRLEFHAWRRQNPVPVVESAIAPSGAPDLQFEKDGRSLRMWRGESDWVVELRASAGYPEMHLEWGEQLPESLRSRRRLSTSTGPLLRHALALRPGGVELRDLALDEILLATPPRPLTEAAGAAGAEIREFCVRLSFQETPPPWPRDPMVWVSPRLN